MPLKERYCALIPHPTASGVLLTRDGDRWALPEFAPRHDSYDQDLVEARRALRERFGVELVVRYPIRLPEPTIGCPLTTWVVGPPEEPPALADGEQWLDWNEWNRLDFAYPRQRRVLDEWRADARGTSRPGLDFPWWKSGWLRETSEWLLPRVAELGYSTIGPIELLKSFLYTAATVRVPAEPSDLYLKVVPDITKQEITVTKALAERFPDRVPDLLADDDRGCWMLTRDMGGQTLGSDVPASRWEAVARTYAVLQVATIGQEGEWVRRGCLDLRLDRFPEAIDDLAARLPQRLHGLPRSLSADERARVGAIVPELRRRAEELAAFALPMALEHGDLHAGNIRVSDDGSLFFDWAGACVTHPFFGLGDLLADDDWFPEDPDFRDRVRDAYLEPWTSVAPMARLQEAYHYAQSLRGVYHVLHQAHAVATYQTLLDGDAPVLETPGGNGLHQMQWWLMQGVRGLIFEVAQRALHVVGQERGDLVVAGEVGDIQREEVREPMLQHQGENAGVVGRLAADGIAGTEIQPSFE